MAKHELTVKVVFDDGLIMLFGNSYRNWDDQLNEYCGMWNKIPVTISASTFPWIGFGGLKWCQWSELQTELDKEGKGRKASDCRWMPLPSRHHKAWDQVCTEAANRRARALVRQSALKP